MAEKIAKRWAMDDWKRDIARYEDCRAKIIGHPDPHFEKLRDHWRRACQEIVDRYPNVKFDPVALEPCP